MKRIILHWTAGRNIPNSIDKDHYHYLIDYKGEIYNGIYKPEDNENCLDGKYAQHTGGGNTGSIGVALCGMLNFNYINKSSEYLLTRIQCEKSFSFIAKLIKKYNLKINKDTLMTHYEFGLAHPKTTSYGKIDIIYLPPFPNIAKNSIGNFIRQKVNWYYQKL